MRLLSVPPTARLAPFVERFGVVESDEEATRVLLPGRGVILGVRYAGAASLIEGDRATRLADTALTGVLATARHVRTHAGGGIVLVHFRPGGAAEFFRVPLQELFGHTVALDALVARAEVERLRDRIASAPDLPARASILETFLLERRVEGGADPMVTAAVSAIDAARGSLRIADLSQALSVSQDHLEKRFRRTVGASPKHLASIVRVLHAVDLGRRGAPWTRVAHEAGYFDQSHFIRDFRAITGDPPARFFRAAEYC